MDVLPNCLPSRVRRTLEKLSKPLDETHERILREINPSRDHTHHLLKRPAVVIRLHRVEAP